MEDEVQRNEHHTLLNVLAVASFSVAISETIVRNQSKAIVVAVALVVSVMLTQTSMMKIGRGRSGWPHGSATADAPLLRARSLKPGNP